MNDQIAKQDDGKIRPSLMPTNSWRAYCAIRDYGCKKYPLGGTENWRKVEPIRFLDALLRHAMAVIDDPNSVDPESGMKHSWHMMTNALFFVELTYYDATGEEDDSQGISERSE